REDPLLVHEENRGRRLPPAVANHGFVLREADLVGAVRDDLCNRVLASERDGLLDDSGGEVLHGITSGTRCAAGSSARRRSRQAPARVQSAACGAPRGSPVFVGTRSHGLPCTVTGGGP